MELIKVDLHNHFKTLSNVDKFNFNKVIDKIRSKFHNIEKQDFVVGLVNFEDYRYEKFTSLKGYKRENIGNAVYLPREGVGIVKGQEIPTRHGHLLVLGLEEGIRLEKDKDLEYTIKEVKEHNGIVIADHPFSKHGLGPYLLNENRRLLDEFDAIETHNGIISDVANSMAGYFFESMKTIYPNLGSLISSDGHSLYEIGSCYMEIPSVDFSNSKTLVDTLKSGLKREREKNEEQKSNLMGKIGFLDHGLKIAGIEVLEKFGIEV